MWLFLSSRLRTWLLFSIAVPAAAKLVHAAAERARSADPSSTTARALGTADSTLRRISGRKAKRHHHA